MLAMPEAVPVAGALGRQIAWLWTVLDCTPVADEKSQGIPGTGSSLHRRRILIPKNKGSLCRNTLSSSLPTSGVHFPLPSPHSCPVELISKLTFCS